MTEIEQGDSGNLDPLLLLWAEKLALHERIAATRLDMSLGEEQAICSPLEDQLGRIETEIAASIPQSIAGAIAMFKLLREVCGINESGDFVSVLANNLLTGLEALQ
jgi:hypothetical protein